MCIEGREGKEDGTTLTLDRMLKSAKTIPQTWHLGVYLAQQTSPEARRELLPGTLQLQVERFGEEVLGAIKQWMKDIGNDKNKIEKLGNMLNIEIIGLARGFTL